MKLNQDKCHLIVSRLIWKWICLCWFVNNLGDWKLLSIIIDRKLNFNDYVTSVWRYVGKKLSVLARLSNMGTKKKKDPFEKFHKNSV